MSVWFCRVKFSYQMSVMLFCMLLLMKVMLLDLLFWLPLMQLRVYLVG